MQESTEEAKASLIPTETVIAIIDVPNLALKWAKVHTVRRKAAKRSEKWYQETAAPLPTPSRKKRRLEEPLLPLRRSSLGLIATGSTGASVPPPNATLVALTLHRSPRKAKTQLSPIDTSEAQLDGDDGDDDDANVEVGDLSGSFREARLSELVEYRKLYGHCNVPSRYSQNTKLGFWVATQRAQYRLRREGKPSAMTLSRIQQLECMGFVWEILAVTWKDRLNELIDYHKTHGHCNVPEKYWRNLKLAAWVRRQRQQYRLHLKGKTSLLTNLRMQELESLGFEWDRTGPTWEEHFSELADYHKTHGHCVVPSFYSENTKLGNWVKTQRQQYKISAMTLSRIQKLESMGFEWNCHCVVWNDRFSELGDYRKIHGHCNVPYNYTENKRLGTWVDNQKTNCRLYQERKKSPMTPLRFQALKSLGLLQPMC
jgi:hypothetical protein